MNQYLKPFLVILLLSVAVSPALAEVKAYLNQASFFEGDPITLKIESTEKNNDEPDLAPLQKYFTVLGVSTSTQLNIMNGRRTYLKSWTVELQPKSKGTLQIPVLSVGNSKTAVIALAITDLPPEVSAETNKHIFIEERVGITSKTTFVQQQIPYTVKLFYDETMQTAQIFTPTLENAILEKLGKDQRYKVTRAGKRFNVVEKRYVISPEKSGTLHIPAPTVKGRIALSGGDSPKLRRRMDETDMLNRFFNDFNNNPFFQDPFGGGGFFSQRSRGPSKPFTVTGNTIDVEVLPVPKAFTGSAWLPAESLVIKDSWEKQPPELKVGEPVTRTLTLQAKGLAGSQIPDIVFPKSDPTTSKIKSYPEKAISETRTDGNTVYGIQQIKISYIPDAKGKVTIPEVKVDWWDVVNKKQQTFTLPAWHLNIAPDLSRADGDNATPIKINSQESVEKSNDESKIPAAKESSKAWNWKIISAVSLFILLLVLLLSWLKKHSGKQQSNLPSKKKNRDVAELKLTLLQACNDNDKELAASLLLKYAQAFWKDDSIQNLGLLASSLSHGENTIKELELSLYSVDSQNWNAGALTQLIETGLQKKLKVEAKDNDGLTPLYPA